MKKKALTKGLALAMALVMAGSMAGCGNDTSNDSQSSEGNQESSEGGSGEDSNDDADTGNASDDADADSDGGEVADDGATASTDVPLPEWEAYDCGGATIRIAAEQIFDSTLESAKEGDSSADYIKKWEYLHALEKKYNCTFEMVTLEGNQGYDEGEAILNYFTNGLSYADIFMKGPAVMLQVRDFLATVEDRDQLKMGSASIDAASWNGIDYGFTYDNIGECFVLCYNRDYLKSVGMAETPGDLFMRGEWSYEDAKNYLIELQSKIPEGSYAIGLACSHYGQMAGGTNGILGISPSGDINIDDERFITALTYYNELLDAQVAAPITGYVEDTSTDNAYTTTENSSMPYNLTDMCGYAGANTHVIANVQNWQHIDPSSADWGIVPYPWGPEVTVEGLKDVVGLDGQTYTVPILSNYFVSRVDFTNVLVAAADYRGEGSKDIPDWVLYQIVREYEDMRSSSNRNCAGTTPGIGSGQAWINAYTAEKNGETASNVNFEPDNTRYFTQVADLVIWNWVSSYVQIDYCKALNDAGYVDFDNNSYLVIAVGKDAKSSGESVKSAGEANLVDQGLK